MNIFRRVLINIKANGFSLTIKKIVFHIYLTISLKTKKNYHLKSLTTRYEKLIKDAKSIEEIYETVQKFHFLGVVIRPLQVKSEILALMEKIQKISPLTVVEIGTNNGGTLALYTNLVSNSALIISIDLPGGAFGGGYPAWKIPFYKSFRRGNQTIELIQGDSHQQETLDQLETLLEGKQIDFLFIDGDHTYEGVKKDFEMYSPLVRSGGLIVFHDVVYHSPELNVHVDKFIKELETKYKVTFLVQDKNQGSFGIAFIEKN